MIYCAISCALYAEWELDYLIFAKVANGQDINPNPDEVADIKWICFEDLDGVMNKSPWFSKLIEGRVLQGLWKKSRKIRFLLTTESYHYSLLRNKDLSHNIIIHFSNCIFKYAVGPKSS